MNWMMIALFHDRSAAETLRQRLQKNNIRAAINDEPVQGRFWFVSKTDCGSRLCVDAAQFERAHSLLMEWDTTENALSAAVRCPDCKSLRVEYPQYARRCVIPNMVWGMIATIGGEKDYYCQDCQFTWPKVARSDRPRAHSAPFYFIEGIEPAPTATGVTKPNV